MPWVPGQSGNPSGARPEVLEVKEVRRLAQQRTKRAFEIVAQIMEQADKDAVRLAAALAVLKLAGVRMDAEVTVPVPVAPRQLPPANVADLEQAATEGEA